jgi:hypothetical protein
LRLLIEYADNSIPADQFRPLTLTAIKEAAQACRGVARSHGFDKGQGID